MVHDGIGDGEEYRMRAEGPTQDGLHPRGAVWGGIRAERGGSVVDRQDEAVADDDQDLTGLHPGAGACLLRVVGLLQCPGHQQ